MLCVRAVPPALRFEPLSFTNGAEVLSELSKGEQCTKIPGNFASVDISETTSAPLVKLSGSIERAWLVL